MLWMQRLCLMLLTALVASQKLHAARILLLPYPWKSHVFEISTIGETLIQHGHQVSMMLPPSYPDFAKIKSRSLFEVLEYRMAERDIYGMPEDDVTDLIGSLMDMTPIEDFRLNIDGFIQFCSNPLSDESFISDLKLRKFDLALVDGFPCGRCYFVIPYRLEIPYVSLTTTYEPWLLRVPAIPSFVPFPLAQFYGEKMSFVERIKNTYTLLDWTLSYRIEYLEDSFIEQYIPDKPFRSLDDLARDSKLWLFSTDVVIDYPRPTMPNEVNIGGLSTKPSKPLPEDLQRFADAAAEGFIVLSFGSFDVLSVGKLKQFLDGFSRINQRVIVRTTHDPEQLQFKVPPNVRIMSWIPQNDLFGHPNCRLFMTHCGANGQFEALYHGIPMLGFPIFGDQPYNARRMEHHGFGRHLDILKIDPETIAATIDEMMTNRSYQENIQKASKTFRGHPLTPRERVAFWIEQVLDDKVDHLRSHALDMLWYEYLMLDILAVLFAAVTLSMAACCGLLCYCINKRGGGVKAIKTD